MAKRRISLYVDGDVYDRVQELLQSAPRPTPISNLVEGLLEDFYRENHFAPQLAKMTPVEREAVLSRKAVQDFLELARQIELTMHKAREGGDVKT